ncbi:ABC transporter substrate-binding protein [Devosia sp. Leaf420]|uniref:BMP family protein n=1 Tax=Devosia sp. Leaf420 TaxID=1736374 RepID=UPI000715D2B4|nr:BMP family protein [Devosia sp. Leaf420]KQT51724.1 ABC transporter substrate-binding protein [Devosia sp. Leaf420]
MTEKFVAGRRVFVSVLAASMALAMSGVSFAQDLTKVAAIWTVPVEQQWASRLHNALTAADERGEIEYVYSENISNTDYERVMREYAEQGVSLIVGEAFGVEQPARAVASEYPEISFLMGSSLPPAEPNFATFDNFIHEPSYLTGIVAGMKTESNKIGMVGGYAIPEVNRLMNAFKAGALSVNPDVTFSVSFINSWYDPPKAKEAAFAMVDAGADILYAERFGVSDAAKERGILAIGNVIDTSADYPGTILASALWHGEPMIDKAIADVKAGSFTASDYGIYAFMEYGGSSVVIDEALAGPEAVAATKAKEEEILAKTFTVEIDDSEPTSSQ